MPNALLNEETFGKLSEVEGSPDASQSLMTVHGTFHKAALLLAVLMVPAAVIWHLFFKAGAQAILPWLGAGVIGGLILCLITVLKKEWAAFTSFPYAICEGLVLGGLSAFLEQKYKGIAIQAVGVTFAIFAVMLVLYGSRVLRVTPFMTKCVIAGTVGVGLLYMVSLLMSAFGFGSIGFIHQATPVGILFSLFVVGLAAFNLAVDFAFIEEGANYGLPKRYEWYGAFCLLVTLVWLYIEVLRLLAKLRRR
jgi:uncharacterized YccA/Bax inhibitor family protein